MSQTNPPPQTPNFSRSHSDDLGFTKRHPSGFSDTIKESLDSTAAHDEYASDPERSDDRGSALAESGELYPNIWARFRQYIREPFAEFLGVCILIIFGTGVVCQVVLSANPDVAPSPKGDYLSLSFGWAVGTAMGVWVSGGISGGHINPAITLALATFRGFPWRKIYIVSQLLGGIVGAAVVYANYFHAIDIVEGQGIRTFKTAGLFSTYTLDYMTNVSSFFNEFLATLVLTIVVLAMNDKRNLQPPSGLAPLVLFMLILGIGAALGMQTGYAINPARDLGPRIMTAMVGYGSEVFTFRSHYWIWCPVMGPILGALFGAFVYDAFLLTGDESVLNKVKEKVRRHQTCRP